jgi:hypothetical protein
LAPCAKNRAFRFNLLAAPKGFPLQSLAQRQLKTRPGNCRGAELLMQFLWAFRSNPLRPTGFSRFARHYSYITRKEKFTATSKTYKRKEKKSNKHKIFIF